MYYPESVCLCMHWGIDREGRREGGGKRQRREKKKELLLNPACSPPALQRWAPGLYSEWTYWLENRTPQSTSSDPRGPHRACSCYGRTCWTNPMSGQNTSSYNHTSGRAEIERGREREIKKNKGEDGAVQRGKAQEEDMRKVRNSKSGGKRKKEDGWVMCSR